MNSFLQILSLAGVKPQISAVMSSVDGGQAYSPGLTAFILMTKDSSMHIAGPGFVKIQLDYDVTEDELGGAEVHASVSGVADLVTEDEIECLEKIKEILSFLPSNNREKTPIQKYDASTKCVARDYFPAAVNSNKPFDIDGVIKAILDSDQFLKSKKNMQ